MEQLEHRQLLAGDTLNLVDDEFSVHQNGAPIALDVLQNDQFGAEYTGPRQITAVSYGSQGGRIEVADDGRSLRYAPPADFAGSEQFSYFVDGQFFATARIEIQPALRNDTYQLPPDGQVHVLPVLNNDPFWAGYAGAKQITLVSATTGDSEAEVAPDGRSILYRPSETASGNDQFLYIVDGHYPARVDISTLAALESDQFELLENTPQQRLNVLANDPFWKQYTGDRRITHVSESAIGATIELAADGKSLIYTPGAESGRYDSFYYTVDGRFETYVSVNVIHPVRDDFQEIDRNSRDYFIDVLSNDTYYSSIQRREMDVIDQVTDVGDSTAGGAVRVSDDGRGVIYTAPRDFFGEDTFHYTADGRHEAVVTVVIARPVRDDYLTVYQDTPNQRLDVLKNDFVGNGYDGDQVLTSATTSEMLVDPVVSGSVIQYTPPQNYTGSDSFVYTVDDELDATVSLSILPLAQHDYYQFCAQPAQQLSLRVLGNDLFSQGYLGPGNIDSAEVLDGGGSVAIAADGQSLEYRPGTSAWIRLQYTVDGNYTADVNVSRDNHLLGDQQVVDQNSTPVVIHVLDNDFSDQRGRCPAAEYRGQRRITQTTESEHGGTITITSDQRSVLYQPPQDFVGTDSFTYIVDDSVEQTVHVQVVRRVRDDQVRVQPGTVDRVNVLANDLFGADYAGAQRITHVTASAIGASVEISADGTHLLYTAPQGFSGSDQLTYTVDGRLKATIDIAVRADGTNAYEVFGTLGDFQDFLIDDAISRYADLFGQSAHFGRGESVDYLPDGPAVDLGASRDFSETNVQVEGIDEGDIVEFDADYIYFLTGRDLVILDAWPAAELSEISRTEIVGDPIAEFLSGDRLTVISQIVEWSDPYLIDDVVSTDALRPISFFPFQPPTYQTITTVFDVSDRSRPQTIQQTTFEGRYVQSRGIGDYVYLALANEAVAPRPKIKPDDEWTDETPFWERTGTYETQDEYLARVRANLGEFVDEALPNYHSSGPDGNVARSGLIHEPNDIFVPLSEGASSLVSLVSVNINNHEPGLTGSSGVYTNGATQVYASQHHFYIFEQGYAEEDGSVTRILQFDWSAEHGGAAFTSSGVVPGFMVNQFSADEYDGHLRIATTVSHSYSGNWTSQFENDLFVVRDDGGVLEFTGSLQTLGLGETTRSVRFMGPRAFLVTFRNVDPLFGLDVSDPTNPRSIGHLTLPGFSSYMQFVDDNHLLTVGRNTPNGVAGPAQVSLFDVSDLAQPELVDEYTMERFSHSEAAVDHHAFGYYARHGLLAVPSSRSLVTRADEDGDGYAETRNWVTESDLMVFRIDVDAPPGSNLGVNLVAEITHDSPVRRSGYIGDYLYSVANNSVHVAAISDPGTILATAAGLERIDPDPPHPVPLPQPFEMSEALQSAQHDVAQRFNLDSGAAVPVVVERSADGWRSVVRLGETYFRYDSRDGVTSLAEVGFDFGTTNETISWQNPLTAADVNGDGHVSLGDAVSLIDHLRGAPMRALSSQRVLRQVDSPLTSGQDYWDVNGDGIVSPLDVLAVVERFNQTAAHPIDLGSLNTNDPQSIENVAAVDAFYRRLTNHAGDANLDGVFDSADLIEAFQHGKYEDSQARNATWSEGDWDGDGDFTSTDLVLAFSRGTYVNR